MFGCLDSDKHRRNHRIPDAQSASARDRARDADRLGRQPAKSVEARCAPVPAPEGALSQARERSEAGEAAHCD